MVYLELCAACPMYLTAGHYFETWLSTNQYDPEFLYGHDEYHIDALLTPGKRICGIGRSAAYDSQPFTEAAKSVPLFAPLHTVSLILNTNVLPDPGTLGQCLYLQVVDHENHGIRISLASSAVTVHWDKRGRFLISLKAGCLAG